VSFPSSAPFHSEQPEPWLRGPLEGVHPAFQPVLFSFAQVREDLAKHTHDITHEALWRASKGGTLGFQLKHIAGSVDRLTTYLSGGQLTQEQLTELKNENEADATLPQLLEYINHRLSHSEQQITELNPDFLFEARSVGRRALPTSVIGLLVHLCEHTQRHLGQAITLAKMLK
jgi:uncharacterized damage-inducible protein DinB